MVDRQILANWPYHWYFFFMTKTNRECVSLCLPQDKESQLTVVTDRSQGGSSIVDGSLEIMVRRAERPLHQHNSNIGPRCH